MAKKYCSECGQSLPKQKGTTFIRIIQDRSGSMGSIWKSTVDSYNEYVNGLKEDENADRMKLGLTIFDNEIETLFKETPIKDVGVYPEEHGPRSMTALYDAIGTSIAELDELVGEDDKALVVIITDGHENSSKEYTSESIKKLIKKREKGNWTFVYLAANQDAWEVGSRFGVAAGNTYQFKATGAGRAQSMGTLRGATSVYTSSVAPSTDSLFGDAGLSNTEQVDDGTTLWTPGADPSDDGPPWTPGDDDDEE